MNKYEVMDLQPGLYRIYWKDSGTSLAAVGIGRSGVKWMAPINWTTPATDQKYWRMVKSVKKLTPL